MPCYLTYVLPMPSYNHELVMFSRIPKRRNPPPAPPIRYYPARPFGIMTVASIVALTTSAPRYSALPHPRHWRRPPSW